MYPVDLGDVKRGHEQRGRRFGIVLSDAPDTWSAVVIVPTSTRAQPAIFRPKLVIAGRTTVALTDQIRAIDTQFVRGEPVDHLTGTDMAQVEFALGRLLHLRINLDY
ncbi:type II toxin-antitoxin system PemK/MazF family toxin [Streptomyces sp. NPDC015139]|uniref:type II toxin-antitoxin system PemK/MazF family toxin n=1 Tax=Streptomyces sp. NPDC015139 TaxID=3364942 RepID=UPI0036FAD312